MKPPPGGSNMFQLTLGSWPQHPIGNAQTSCKAQQPSLHGTKMHKVISRVCFNTLNLKHSGIIQESFMNHSWIIHESFMIFSFEISFSVTLPFSLQTLFPAMLTYPAHRMVRCCTSLTGSRKSPGRAGVAGMSSSRARPEIQTAGAARASTKKRSSSESAWEQRGAEILHRNGGFFVMGVPSWYPNGWMVCKGTSYFNGWFKGYPTLYGTPEMIHPKQSGWDWVRMTLGQTMSPNSTNKS